MPNQWTAFDDLFYDPEPEPYDTISYDLPGYRRRTSGIFSKSSFPHERGRKGVWRRKLRTANR